MNDEVPTNPKPEGYRDLIVWQKGIELAKVIYLLTKTFPPEERFGLVTQMRRAAVSVPSNIAEGQARHTTGEFIRYLSYAEGSVAELDTQLHLSMELGILEASQTTLGFQLLDELRRMLNSLRRKLASRD